MSTSWLWPAIACLLLWLPFASALTLRKDGQLRRLSQAPTARALLFYWPNWVDLVRSIIAIGLLVEWGKVLSEESPEAIKVFYGILLGIVVVAFFIQAVILSVKRYLYTPLPLFIACALWTPGVELGAFAIVATWAFCTAARKFDLVIPILAVILLFGGFVLGTGLIQLGLAVTLVMLPQALAIMFSRRMILPAKVLPSA